MEPSLTLSRTVEPARKGSRLRPWACQLNGQTDPIGLRGQHLRFSWRLPAAMREQASYEMRAWRESDRDDSLTQGGESCEPWCSRTVPPAWSQTPGWIIWQVRCHDAHGQASEWSEECPAFLRGPTLAPARWLGGPGYHLLRRTFTLGATPVKRAALLIAADAHSYAREHWDSMEEPGEPASNWMFGGSHIKYRAFLNGELIALGPPRSIGTEPAVQGFEVGAHLRPGPNTLCFISLGESLGVAAHLQITDEDGTESLLSTDNHWRSWAAEGVFRPFCWERPGLDQFFKGFAGPGVLPEHIDGARWPQGWLESGFDDSDWERPQDNGPADVPFEDAGLPPYKFRVVKFVKATKLGERRYCLDAGKQIFGSIRIDFTGAEDSELELRLGEELRDDGSVRYRLRTENCYQEGWKPPLEPARLEHLGCRAFRYAEVIGLPDSFPLENIAITVPEYPWDDEASSFQCSSEDLTRVWNFCRYSVRATNFDLHTDCLTRERQPYEGDAYVTALSHYATQADSLLARRTFEYLITHPTWPQEWALMMPMLLWMDYWQSGDSNLARRYVEEIWKRMAELRKQPGLIEHFPQRILVDWPPSTRDEYQFGPGAAVPNAYLYEALRCLEKLLNLTNRKAEAQEAANRAQALRRAFHDQLFDPKRSLYVDHAGSDHASFHANLYALRFGLAPNTCQTRIARHLAQRGLVGSVFTSQFLLETLFASGEDRAAVALMTRSGVPGWLAMMDCFGATIGMEAWSPEEKPNVSFGHPWASAPANVVVSGLFGLRATSPGWRTFAFEPRPGGLTSAELRLPTPQGTIEASWRVMADGTLQSSVWAPESCRRLQTSRNQTPSPGWFGYSLSSETLKL